MSDAGLGSFVWYDLATTDPVAAVEFYKHVVGWGSQAFGPEYTVFTGEQGPVGGATTQTERAKKAGAPPGWVSSVRVADVDASVATAKKLGGRVLREPSDYPNVGRLALIADPQGAPINVLAPQQPMRAHDPSAPGEFTWSELLTTDQGAAFRFYAELFGWKKRRDLDLGASMGHATYVIFGLGDRDIGGIFATPKERPVHPHWVYYVEVKGLDAAIERAKAMGATLLNGPMEVPGGARVAQLDDPQGGGFALHEGKVCA